MSSTYKCSTPINVSAVILNKFRTGSYLIYDYDPAHGSNNFRVGTGIKDTPFRASGSHQLDVSGFATILKPLAPPGTQLYLVDLREETHLFFDGQPVSWYADKDFANVGQTLDWIVADEAAQLKRITDLPTTQLYCINEDAQGNVTPTGYIELSVKSAATEEDVAAQFPFRPKYIRFPVTDHCMPSEDALNGFVELCVKLKRDDWLHCHCHGGDGRTTTFLALFDMVNWFKTNGTSAFPTLDVFAERQCQIFSYCLNPNGCPDAGKCKATPTIDWKYYLAVQRWRFLDLVRTWIVNGGLSSGNPFRLPEGWEQRIACD